MPPAPTSKSWLQPGEKRKRAPTKLEESSKSSLNIHLEEKDYKKWMGKGLCDLEPEDGRVSTTEGLTSLPQQNILVSVYSWGDDDTPQLLLCFFQFSAEHSIEVTMCQAYTLKIPTLDSLMCPWRFATWPVLHCSSLSVLKAIAKEPKCPWRHGDYRDGNIYLK